MSHVAERSEILLSGPAEALGALLGVPAPDLAHGENLPLLWHWIYLLDRPRQADLGPDGHPISGTILAPPKPGQRRMWAGGRVHSRGQLRFGEEATKRTSVLSVQEKQGRSGPLIFVVLAHQIWQDDRLTIDEQQDIVYQDAVSSAVPPGVDPKEAPIVPLGDDEWALDVSPTLLFRFSALTYNAHRIHYDREYARSVEGYPGLVTHGPLQAIAMAEACRARGYDGNLSFEYRLTSPLFEHQGMIVKTLAQEHATKATVRDIHGRQTASAVLARADQPEGSANN